MLTLLRLPKLCLDLGGGREAGREGGREGGRDEMSKRSNQVILLFQVQREAGRKEGRE